MDLILANTPITLEWRVYVAGTLTDLEASPAPAVVAEDGGGSTVSLTPSNTGTGIYQATHDVGDPTILQAQLTGELPTDRTYAPPAQLFEVVGGLLFTEAQAREYKGPAGQTPLSAAEYTDERLAELHADILDAFGHDTGRSWVPRYCRAEFMGSGTRSLYVPKGRRRTQSGIQLTAPGLTRDIQEILSVTVDGTAVGTSNVVIDGSVLWRKDADWTAANPDDPFNVVVEWVAGVRPTAEVTRRALETAVEWGVHSTVSPYATQRSLPDGTNESYADGRVFPKRVWRWLRNADRRIPIA